MKKTVQDRTRWNVTIAIASSILVLVIAAVAIYLVYRKSSEIPAVVLEKEFRNNHEMAFVLIQAGSFEMGSPDSETGHKPEEGPVHKVDITKPFYMGTTEVTLRQFQSVTAQLPTAYIKLNLKPEELDVPAAMIHYGEALAFVKKLNSDSTTRLEGWEYRLPTEAEWEYACRAGSKTRYAFGDNLGRDQAAFGDTTNKFPGKVAQFAPNAWGLYDMHGNAAEWVSDLYDPNYYKDSPPQDPTGAAPANMPVRASRRRIQRTGGSLPFRPPHGEIPREPQKGEPRSTTGKCGVADCVGSASEITIPELVNATPGPERQVTTKTSSKGAIGPATL